MGWNMEILALRMRNHLIRCRFTTLHATVELPGYVPVFALSTRPVDIRRHFFPRHLVKKFQCLTSLLETIPRLGHPARQRYRDGTYSWHCSYTPNGRPVHVSASETRADLPSGRSTS